MGERIPKLILGLAVILVCLTGLMAVSGLVPDVGCEERVNSFLETKTSLKLFAPSEVKAGETFGVNGTLYKVLVEGSGTSQQRNLEPFPQQRINLNVAGRTGIVHTDNEGNFTADLTVKDAGTYPIVAYYPGDRMLYYVDSGDVRNIVVTGETQAKPIDYSWLSYPLIGIILVAIGYLLFVRFNRIRRPKKATRTARHEAALIVTKKRSWQLRPWLSSVIAVVVVSGIIFALWPRAEEPVVRGVEPSLIVTKTRLEAPAEVGTGQPFIIKGRLTKLEDHAESPLPEREISIVMSPLLGVTTEIGSVLTDAQGNFTFETVLERPGEYDLAAVFEDTGGRFFDSSDVRGVTVGAIGTTSPWDLSSRGWLSIIRMPLTLLIGLACLLYYRHYRKTHQPEAKVTIAEAAAAPPSPPVPPPKAAASDSSLRIDFPQIARPFPDVWGRGEGLLVLFTVDESRGQRSTGNTLAIELGPNSKGEAALGQGGRVSRDHVYASTGQYEIKAAYAGESRNGYLPASRLVRIVDYREEIVRLYNEMVTLPLARGMALSPKMTAREVEDRLVKGMPDLPRDAVAQLVSMFEEANYSLHAIGRPAYERMYLAFLEVERRARK